MKPSAPVLLIMAEYASKKGFSSPEEYLRHEIFFKHRTISDIASHVGISDSRMSTVTRWFGIKAPRGRSARRRNKAVHAPARLNRFDRSPCLSCQNRKNAKDCADLCEARLAYVALTGMDNVRTRSDYFFELNHLIRM